MDASRLKYLPVDGLLHLAALLPLWLLYGLADVVFVIMYYLWGYRKKTVLCNLRESFPDRTDRELNAIARRFYHNLADQIVETVKLLQYLRPADEAPHDL